MKKNIMLAVLAAFAVLMTGCTNQESASESNQPMTSLSIQKNGSIENIIMTEFSQAYYDIDGLKTMIEENITAYQREHADSQVTLEKCELSGDNDDMVRVEMIYSDGEAYTDFNKKTLFAGTIQEAYEEGYDLNVSLTSVSDEASLIGRADLLSMGTNHIVILEESMRVTTFDDILYVSDQVTKVGKRTVDVTQESGYSIIVFQ